ncbi:MAG: hypothetical protein U0575_15240 [Phycisphaerales bacterium]
MTVRSLGFAPPSLPKVGRVAALLLSLGFSAATCLAANSSSPIALTGDDKRVWVVNPDNNSVSVMNVEGDANVKLAEIAVGQAPARLAIKDDAKVYVTNQRSGTVSVIDANPPYSILSTISVGTEPVGCALRPDGTRLFVANFASGSVSIIDTSTDQVVSTVDVGPRPRAIAATDKLVYVTLFLALVRDDGTPINQLEGFDNGKQGHVIVLDAGASDSGILADITLEPLANVGFNSNGSVLGGVPATNPATFTFPTGAFPNQLDSIVIKGDRAYLPNTAASPNGPVRFNVNVQSFLSVLNTVTGLDSGQTINMNKGIQFEPTGQKLFITNPVAIAFKHGSDEGFVVSAATDRLVRVELGVDGAPTINAPTAALPPGQQSNVVRIEVGVDPPGNYHNSNPQGLVINSTDTRAYVMNYVSRDVSVVSIDGDPSTYLEIGRIASADLPPANTQEAIVHRGKELFNTSIGPAGTNDNALPPAGRMSDFGWGSCYSCHPGGLHDGVTWMFGDGPRQTISMESTFGHPPADASVNANGAPLLPLFHQRALNWSAVRDEVQDFELNIRNVSGGQGLITDGLPVTNLQPTANTGRSADLDALAAYIASGIRAPLAPDRGSVFVGQALFQFNNCHSCHGGKNWDVSHINFAPPPLTPPVTITGGQMVAFLKQVGTFDAAAPNEVRPSGTTLVLANGALGFNPPSLLSVSAGAPYLHSGNAATLADVLENVAHRSAGRGGVDFLSSPRERAELVKFLESIDETTPKFYLSSDINGDGFVDGADLGVLLGEWGPCPGCRSDLDENNIVDGADLGLLLGDWGY